MAKRFLIKEKMAIKLFKALGFVTAENWTTDRLQKKLNNLPEITDEDKVNEWVQGYLKRIEKADEVIIKEKEVENMAKKKKNKGKGKKKKVEGKANAVTQETAQKKEKKKKDKKKSALKKDIKKTVTKKNDIKKTVTKKNDIKKTVVKKSTTTKKDQFGTKLGTQGATINACLSKKGITLEAISKKIKMTTKRINDHLWGMCKKGVVKKNDKKEYSIA